jgi:hypothetical protein
MGFYLGFAITEWFFLSVLILSYLLFILLNIGIDFRKGTSQFFKADFSPDYKAQFTQEFSVFTYIKRFKITNSLLLTILLLLICILGIIETSFFIGTDPWMHISIINYITDINYLPLSDYFGTFGFHVFGSVIYFFSGLEIILIPKFFVFYTFSISSLIIYNLLIRIFKNKNLAIMGIFILTISSLGFLNMMYQFWPSSLALILGLTLFFLLYIRLESFTQEKEPTNKQILSNLSFSYLLFIVIFISCLLIHSLISVILLVSFFWVYLIYFVKSYRRGFDLILLGISLCIFFIFYFFNISTGHFTVFARLGSISWYYILFGIGAIGILEGLILFHYRKSMIFLRGRFSLIISGEKHKIFKKVEEKYLFPAIFAIVVSIIIIFSIANFLLFNFDFITIFTGFEILIIWSFAIWGLILFQYKPRGKPLLLWGFGLGIILLAGISFDFITGSFTFFSRIFYLSSVIITIGFVSYFYKLIKTNSIQKLKIKFLLILIASFSSTATYLEFSSSVEFFSLTRREVSTVQWYSNYTSNQNVVIAEFGWSSIFIYYDYPFNEKNITLPLNSIIKFYTASNDYLNPQYHFQNGTNTLKALKKNSGKDVFLILVDNYLLVSGFELFGQLTTEEIELYYNLTYLNRICVSKGKNGMITPYYWVI